MTRLYLARHGRTEWNRDVRFRGRADLALDEVGRAQARALAEALSPRGIEVICASPLQRAGETARAVAGRLGLQVQPLEGLLDVDYGQWQGLSPDEAKARDPVLHTLWSEQPEKVRFPGGEGLREVRERALGALETVAREKPGGTALLVSHEVVLRVLLCACLGLDNSHFWRVHQEVAALNLVEWTAGRFKVLFVNDTCHLAGLR